MSLCNIEIGILIPAFLAGLLVLATHVPDVGAADAG